MLVAQIRKKLTQPGEGGWGQELVYGVRNKIWPEKKFILHVSKISKNIRA